MLPFLIGERLLPIPYNGVHQHFQPHDLQKNGVEVKVFRTGGMGMDVLAKLLPGGCKDPRFFFRVHQGQEVVKVISGDGINAER